MGRMILFPPKNLPIPIVTVLRWLGIFQNPRGASAMPKKKPKEIRPKTKVKGRDYVKPRWYRKEKASISAWEEESH